MLPIEVGNGLVLRTYKPEDAAALFRAVDANRAHLRPWLPWVDATQKPEHSLDFIEQSISWMHHQQGLALGIFEGEEVIGGLGMLGWNHELRNAQIGYWIAKNHEGKGIISACLEKFIDLLFEQLDLNKVEIRFVVANKRSAAVAQKLHAKIEGVLRDAYVCNGVLEDLVIAGILKREWKLRKES